VSRREQVVLAVTVLVLIAAGVVTGVVEAYLVPQRVFSGTEGLAVVLAFTGNAVIGAFAGVGTRTAIAAAAPLVGWFGAVALLSTTGPGGDVILPGSLPNDPGVVHVASLLLLGGIAGGGLALLLTSLYTRRANPPTPPM
jgi:hypothetical protein